MVKTIKCPYCKKVFIDADYIVCPVCKKPLYNEDSFNDLFGMDNPFKDIFKDNTK